VYLAAGIQLPAGGDGLAAQRDTPRTTEPKATRPFGF
jgi:hypothetical protein